MHQITQIITFHLFLGQMVAHAQSNNYPSIGDPCPKFSLKVLHHTAPELSNTDFIGKKWLIIDFWSKTCKYCIETLPDLNTLQAEFQEDVQFMLVGINTQKYNKGIEELYEKQRAKHDLKLTVAFDSTLKESFQFQVIPHVIIVDKEGIIYGIVGSKDLTKEKLTALIAGKKPVFELKEY